MNIRGDVYETEAYHHLRSVTVIVEEDQINTLVSSPGAFIQHYSTYQSFQLLCQSWEKVEMKTE